MAFDADELGCFIAVDGRTVAGIGHADHDGDRSCGDGDGVPVVPITGGGLCGVYYADSRPGCLCGRFVVEFGGHGGGGGGAHVAVYVFTVSIADGGVNAFVVCGRS